MDLKNLQGQWAVGRQCWPLDATRKPRSDTKMTPHLPRHTVSAFTLWSWVIWRAAQSAPCNALHFPHHFHIFFTTVTALSPPCHRTFRNSRCQQISCRENVERHTQADHISAAIHGSKMQLEIAENLRNIWFSKSNRFQEAYGSKRPALMLTRPVQTYFRWIMVNLIEMSAARHRCANCRNVSFGHVWPCLAHAPGSGFLFHSGRCVSHLPLQLLWHRGAAAHARLMLDHFGCPNCWQLERVCKYLQYLTVSYSILQYLRDKGRYELRNIQRWTRINESDRHQNTIQKRTSTHQAGCCTLLLL